MSFQFRVLTILLVGFLAAHVSLATRIKDDTQLTRTVTRSYKSTPQMSVSIVNKYGPVVINNWDKDSIKVEIEITAFGKTYRNVSKTLERVDIDFNQSSLYLEIETILDRSSGFFTEVWNNIGDYSKTLLSQNKLKIEYKVFMPKTLALTIENKFGDIYLRDYDGRLRITMSHGNLRAANLQKDFDLDLSFGNADIRSIPKGRLSLKASETEIQKAGRIDMVSSSSEILIHDVDFIRLDSRSDRRFDIRKVRILRGVSSFSKIDVENLLDDANFETTYGELRLRKISPGFARVELDVSTTDVTLEFAEGARANFEYIGRPDRVDILGGESLEREDLSDSDRNVRISGIAGKGNSAAGKVIIRSTGGDISVSF